MVESARVSKISEAVGGEVTSLRTSALITLGPERVGEACRLVVGDGDFYHLSTITGVDEGESIAIFYHFWSGRGFITLKTSVQKTSPKLPSVAGSLPASLFYEAEVMDLLGVVFEGNPLSGKRLLLPDTYPSQAPPPLRNEADPEKIRKMMELE